MALSGPSTVNHLCAAGFHLTSVSVTLQGWKDKLQAHIWLHGHTSVKCKHSYLNNLPLFLVLFWPSDQSWLGRITTSTDSKLVATRPPPWVKAFILLMPWDATRRGWGFCYWRGWSNGLKLKTQWQWYRKLSNQRDTSPSYIFLEGENYCYGNRPRHSQKSHSLLSCRVDWTWRLLSFILCWSDVSSRAVFS